MRRRFLRQGLLAAVVLGTALAASGGDGAASGVARVIVTLKADAPLLREQAMSVRQSAPVAAAVAQRRADRLAARAGVALNSRSGHQRARPGGHGARHRCGDAGAPPGRRSGGGIRRHRPAPPGAAGAQRSAVCAWTGLGAGPGGRPVVLARAGRRVAVGGQRRSRMGPRHRQCRRGRGRARHRRARRPSGSCRAGAAGLRHGVRCALGQ